MAPLGISNPVEDFRVSYFRTLDLRGNLTLTLTSNVGLAFSLHRTRFATSGEALSPCCAMPMDSVGEMQTPACRQCGLRSRGYYWFALPVNIDREKWLRESVILASSALDLILASMAADSFIGHVERLISIPHVDWTSAVNLPLLV